VYNLDDVSCRKLSGYPFVAFGEADWQSSQLLEYGVAKTAKEAYALHTRLQEGIQRSGERNLHG